MSLDIQDGSVKTLWKVSLPLILSFLSMLGMVTVDRLFLASYSAEALGAAVSGGLAAWALTFGGQTLTNISGVFVAQYNGSKQYHKIGRPVWQMVWLSLMLCIPFALMAWKFAPWAFAGSPLESHQILYYRWTMATSPLMCLLGAFNGFFIGRGKTMTITWLTLLGNLINLVLDPILIFGWGPIPSFGISGACFATGVGLFSQNIILLYIILKKKNRQTYGTGNIKLHLKSFWNMIRIGSPEALAITLELGAWATFYCLLSGLSAIHILVTSVAQSLLMAFFFFSAGMEHGISSVCGNLIGSNRKDEVSTAFRSGLKITALFGIALITLLWVGGDWLVDLFLKNPENLEGAERITLLTPAEFETAREYILSSCIIIGIYILVESIRGLLYGILRSAGDTVFILALSVISIWFLLLLPTYVLMTLWEMPVDTSFWIWLTFAIISTVICYARFASGGWKKRSLISA